VTASAKQRSDKIIIAIDGYSSCGKSTLARDLAKKLGYSFIDSGAMYRAVTLFCIQNHIDIHNEAAVAKALPKIKIGFKYNKALNKNETYLNNVNVEEDIRSMQVAEKVSIVSSYKLVREAMVKQQQEMGKHGGIVMDGRDIGTVVFPDAELKIFLTADFQTRVERRLKELAQKGIIVSREEVAKNLQERDLLDIRRTESPLRKADDAREIDNTFMTPEEQLKIAYFFAQEAIKLKKR
jgi:cytidylate kinase